MHLANVLNTFFFPAAKKKLKDRRGYHGGLFKVVSVGGPVALQIRSIKKLNVDCATTPPNGEWEESTTCTMFPLRIKTFKRPLQVADNLKKLKLCKK